jgi:hypothetical protein
MAEPIRQALSGRQNDVQVAIVVTPHFGDNRPVRKASQEPARDGDTV